MNDTLLYGCSQAFSKCLSLISFPILTSSLNPTDYGLLEFLGIICTFISIVCIFGFDSSLGRFFFDSDDINKRNEVVSVCFIWQFIVVVLVSIILFNYIEIIFDFLKFDKVDNKYLFIVIFQFPALVFYNFSLNITKWTFNKKGFFVIVIWNCFYVYNNDYFFTY